MIVIVDYGMGNVGSIQNMLKRIGIPSAVSANHADIVSAEKLILPGVGAFDTAMTRIDSNGLRPLLDKKALIEKVPILGICLGMQLMTECSEEGHLAGFGWIPARTIRFNFPAESRLRIPHMGWNVAQPSTPSALTESFLGEQRFYFVHSFHVRVKDEKYSILKTEYGGAFDSGIQSNNIFGVQFHPEKSHKFGMNLLARFARL